LEFNALEIGVQRFGNWSPTLWKLESNALALETKYSALDSRNFKSEKNVDFRNQFEYNAHHLDNQTQKKLFFDAFCKRLYSI
jgi:hypothetical protein